MTKKPKTSQCDIRISQHKPKNGALDDKKTAHADWLRLRVDEAFADPRPSVPMSVVFKRLRKHHAAQVKAAWKE